MMRHQFPTISISIAEKISVERVIKQKERGEERRWKIVGEASLLTFVPREVLQPKVARTRSRNVL